MASNCRKCKFEDIDYVWDDECGEEFENRYCSKGHDVEFENDCECPYFRKYRLHKYIERDTKCDKCDILKNCIASGDAIDCTLSADSRKHYIGGCGNSCKKKGEIE